MKKTIIFDFNGTIIDDLNLCLDILNQLLKENGKETITMERYKEIFTFPIEKYYLAAGFDFSIQSFDELSKRFIGLYQKASLSCPLHQNFRLVAGKFKSLGYQLVVLSASQIDNLKEQLEHFKILDLFDYVLGIDNIYAKSKTTIGVNFIKDHCLNPNEVYMIGDTLHDFETANSMGIHCALFSKGHQSKTRLMQSGAKVVDTLEEFEKWVE